MKKTLTINISGTVFHIDEDAYDKLKTYLLDLSLHFRNEEGGEEIIHDIEARVAELFTHKTSNNQDVVTIEMVNEMIDVMGMPEDFANAGEDASDGSKEGNFSSPGYSRPTSKRLYRDPESRVIGGVCSGLGHYLKMDKVLVRILFIVLLLVTSGVALPAYLILWIAVPKARTTSQRLEMKGEDVNVNNIGKSVKEEFSEMKDNFEKYKNSKEFQKGKEYARKAGQGAQYAGREAASVITKVFGVLILLFGIISLIGLIFGILFTTKAMGFVPAFITNHPGGLFFDHLFSGGLATTFMISIFIIAGIPLLLLIYAGTKMLFNYYSNSRNIVLTALGVWIIAIVVAIGSSLGAVDVFSSEGTVTDRIELTNSPDTLYVQVNEKMYDEIDDSRFEFNNVKVVMKNDQEILVARPKFDIEPTSNEVPELKIRKSSRGNSYKQAKENAENMVFHYSLNHADLVLDPYFTIDKNDKWRSQDLRITLKLPKGTVVYLNDNLLPVIHDIENTTNTWDGDMTNEYWQMKPEGLTLIKALN